jgi:hypothetical protein
MPRSLLSRNTEHPGETTGSVNVLSVCFLVALVSFVTLLLAGFTVAFVLVLSRAQRA